MMGEIITIAWAAGLGAFAGYHFSERRHRDDLPQWTAVLGSWLCNQFEEVIMIEKFAGCSPFCSAIYGEGDNAFLVTVERVEG